MLNTQPNHKGSLSLNTVAKALLLLMRMGWEFGPAATNGLCCAQSLSIPKLRSQDKALRIKQSFFYLFFISKNKLTYQKTQVKQTYYENTFLLMQALELVDVTVFRSWPGVTVHFMLIICLHAYIYGTELFVFCLLFLFYFYQSFLLLLCIKA